MKKNWSSWFWIFPGLIHLFSVPRCAAHRGNVAVMRIILLLLLLPCTTSSQDHGGDKQPSGLGIGPNFRIYPSSVTQTETFITRHPSDPNILFASANTINPGNGFISEGVYVTTNGGASWYGSDTCDCPPITFHRGDPGIAIDRHGRFILIQLGFPSGLYSCYSTNSGLDWMTRRTVATNDQDRATLISDGNPSSSYYGRSYAAWVRFAPPYPVFYSFTDNGAETWSSPAQINNPSQRGQGGELALGPNGTVSVCWAAVIGTSPFTEDYVGYASSTSGGATWNVTENAFDVNGIAGVLSVKANIRVNGLPRIDVDKSGGPRNGWIYIVTTERNLAPAGTDPDIILHRSTNNGTSWSSGVRVNQDALNNGKYQYFPAIHVDDGGGVNIIYYDDKNTTSDSAGVYLARSTDGGTVWREFEISDHNFQPQPIGGLGQGYQGDNIGLASSGQTLWPVWMDNSSGLYQIWTCPIDLSALGIPHAEGSVPESFELEQNYPNPFNSSTTLSFSVPFAAPVNLRVYDLLGREIATLMDGMQDAGYKSVRFSGDGTGPSGVYFYRLTAPGFSATRSMLLLK